MEKGGAMVMIFLEDLNIIDPEPQPE